MSEAKFTPGPWQAVLSTEQQPQIFYHGLICVLERSPEQWTSVVAVNGYADADRETLDANATLIAAVTDLYAACESALVELQFYLDSDAAPKLEAALKKARGE